MGPQFCSGRRRPCRAEAAPGRSRGSRPPPEPPLPPPPPRGAARAPVRVRPASMAFLTAWKGAASGKRDRRYQAGRGLGGRRGPGGGAAGELPRGHSGSQQCAGAGRGQRPRARGGASSPLAPHAPAARVLGPPAGLGLGKKVGPTGSTEPGFGSRNVWTT